jgi:mycothiol system anti-sigma-R factor
VNCRECLDRMWQYIDGELDVASTEEFQRHLEQCRACFTEAEFERRLKEMVRRACGGEQAPAHLRERLAKILQLF